MPMSEDDKQTAHGYVLLQAATAEGALGDIPTAYRRAKELAGLGDPAATTLVRIACDLVCRLSLRQGADWTTSKDDDGNPVPIEERSPKQRVFTRRLMAAWSLGDTGMFDALLSTALTDPRLRAGHLQDVFRFLADQAEMHGKRASQPFTVVRQLNRSILKEGFKRADWNRVG